METILLFILYLSPIIAIIAGLICISWIGEKPNYNYPKKAIIVILICLIATLFAILMLLLPFYIKYKPF